MDVESWFKGYETGIMLHRHFRNHLLRPSVVAAVSAIGFAADFDWLANLSGVETLTLLTAEYVGEITVAYSYDSENYTTPVLLPEFLQTNPTDLFLGCNPETPNLWFKFHLANSDADLTSFTLWGVFANQIPWKVNQNGL